MSMHETLMRQAIELSRLGYPAYAHVGCVIVRNGEIVGSGFHDYTGGPHAEVVALAEAGEKAKGSTVYVTLEPCNHFGKTPPCSDALIQHGVSKVVIAMRDPNPKAAGGIEKLRSHGIDVIEGVLPAEAAEANLQFLFATTQGRPLVTAKAGITLDGKIAMPNGESQWITSQESRQDAMELRAKISCVMAGRKTIELDRARLNVRGVQVVNQPLRVALDPRGVLDANLPIFDDSAPTLHLKGVADPEDILQLIRENGRTGVLIEGGAVTQSHFFRAGLIDQIVLYIAPKVLGEGKDWVGTFGLQNLEQAPEFELTNTKILGSDVRLTYRSGNLSRYLASYKM